MMAQLFQTARPYSLRLFWLAILVPAGICGPAAADEPAGGAQAQSEASSDGPSLRGHAKFYLSQYDFDSTAAEAANVPESFADQALDFRLIAQKAGDGWSAEIQTQFDTLSTRFAGPVSQRASSQAQTATRPALPDDRLRFADLTFDPDNQGSLTSALHIDRLNAGFGDPGAGLILGRQAISWGNGLVFSVLDLVSPFTPTAIDREYKPGDDGIFLRKTAGESTDIESFAVLRRDIDDRELRLDSSLFAAKARKRLSEGEHAYSLEAVCASRYGDGLLGGGFSGDFSGFVSRLDATATWLDAERTYGSLVANIDRGFILEDKNWYAFLEYYRNGFGRDDRLAAARFEPLIRGLRRGDLFVSGRDYLAPGLRVELSARNQLQNTLILNLRDGSGIVQPQYVFLYRENLEFTLQATIPFGASGDDFGGTPFEADGQSATLHPPISATLLVSGYF